MSDASIRNGQPVEETRDVKVIEADLIESTRCYAKTTSKLDRLFQRKSGEIEPSKCRK
jgi:hypothetical protein